MSTDKKQLVAACQQKDPEAMKQIYEEFAPAMLGVCMRYTHSRDEAQDLLHDGFIKAFESIGKLRDPEALEAWLRQIMVSVSVDFLKREKVLVYRDMESMIDHLNEPYDDALDLDGEEMRIAQIVKVLQSLPAHYRVVFNMREVEEMKFEDIAIILHLPETTVRSYVARAKKMLRDKIIKKGI